MSPIRERLEAIIEEAIAMLDRMDGDHDLEDNGDHEPSLAGPGYYRNGVMELDLEADHGDHEPNLGWSEHQSENGKPPLGEEFHPDCGRLIFDGKGSHQGNDLLQRHRLPTVRLMVGVGI